MSSPLRGRPAPRASIASVSESKIVAVPSVSLVDVLNSLPPPLTVLLAELGPYVALLRAAAELVSWKAPYSSCWLLLGCWWTLCLLSQVTLKYMLPPFLLLLFYFRSYLRPPSYVHVTEHTIQSTILDLSVIQGLLNLDAFTFPSISLSAAVHLALYLYIPYVLLTHFVRLRILVAFAGTWFLTYRAPWARSTRTLLWRSAWVRQGFFYVWIHLTGQARTVKTTDISPVFEPMQASKSFRFLLTIYENQRWWVGLDWTAALLPNERPSWSSAALEAMSPPSAFSLPAPTSVLVGDGKGGLVRKTAYWSWGEGEWKVIVKRESLGTKRVEKALPVMKDETPQPPVSSTSSMSPTSGGPGRLEKTIKNVKDITKDTLKDAKDKMKEVGNHSKQSSVQSERDDTDIKEQDDDSVTALADDIATGEPFTDVEGWVYGDNQWKGQSSQGGLGKFTRYRRWTRIAILQELVDVVSAAEVQSEQASFRSDSKLLNADKPGSSLNDGIRGRASTLPESQPGEGKSDTKDGDDSQNLRKRLKAFIAS